MRAVLTADLDMAARALAQVPPAQRPALFAQLAYQAHAADKFRKTTARRHPEWGSGTLADAAATLPLAAPAADALAAVLAGLALWRSDAAR